MSKGAEMTIDAQYPPMIWPFTGRDKTRYYLNGFWVQPHQSGGAIIVATDGPTMAVFRDTTAKVAVPGIIRLSKLSLSACKLGKGEARRVVVVEGDRASIYRNWDEESNAGILVAAEDDAVIDADFPEWRKIVPPIPSTLAAASLNGTYLSRFEKISRFGSAAAVRLFAATESDAVVVLTDRDDFIGIVMPMRADHKYPLWLPVAEQPAHV